MVVTKGKKRFKKFCSRCERLFQPLGRYDKYCNKCLRGKYYEVRFVNERLNKYFIKLNKLK